MWHRRLCQPAVVVTGRNTVSCHDARSSPLCTGSYSLYSPEPVQSLAALFHRRAMTALSHTGYHTGHTVVYIQHTRLS